MFRYPVQVLLPVHQATYLFTHVIVCNCDRFHGGDEAKLRGLGLQVTSLPRFSYSVRNTLFSYSSLNAKRLFPTPRFPSSAILGLFVVGGP